MFELNDRVKIQPIPGNPDGIIIEVIPGSTYFPDTRYLVQYQMDNGAYNTLTFIEKELIPMIPTKNDTVFDLNQIVKTNDKGSEAIIIEINITRRRNTVDEIVFLTIDLETGTFGSWSIEDLKSFN